MSTLAFNLVVIVGTAALGAEPAKEPVGSVHVECHGQLRHGVVAIGGETTGTTITFDQMTWELKLPDDPSRELAQQHHKKRVCVVGTLRQVAGTTIPLRWIIDVERISAVDGASPKAGTTAIIRGILHAADNKNESSPMVIDAAGMKWPLDLGDTASNIHAKSLVGKSVIARGRVERTIDEKSPPKPILCVRELKTHDSSKSP